MHRFAVTGSLDYRDQVDRTLARPRTGILGSCEDVPFPLKSIFEVNRFIRISCVRDILISAVAKRCQRSSATVGEKISRVKAASQQCGCGVARMSERLL